MIRYLFIWVFSSIIATLLFDLFMHKERDPTALAKWRCP
jgi:hypothetical protein